MSHSLNVRDNVVEYKCGDKCCCFDLIFQVNIIIPVIVLIISCYLVVAPIIDNPQLEYLYASLFILAGLIFYVPFVYFKIELKIMSK